jgi:hypothetical protein
MQECDREADALPGEPADSNTGYPGPVRRDTWERGAEEKEGEETTGQRTKDGPEGWNSNGFAEDLSSIDGVNVMTAFTVISEVGTDMSRCQDENHFASWMGLNPNKHISSGKTVGRSKKKVKNRVAVVLRTAATSLLDSDTHLGARYRQLSRQIPTVKVAVKAMARHLAVLIFRLLTKGDAWVDRGAAQFERRRAEQELATLLSKAKRQKIRLGSHSGRLPELNQTAAKLAPENATLARSPKCVQIWRITNP